MGYVFTVAKCVISWKTELQDTISLSMTEAEYIVAVNASKEALWLRGLAETFGIMQDSIRVHCDSQSVIHLAKDHMYHKRMKHVNVRYHKIRQWVVDDKVIDLVNISTKKNPTNMMMNISVVKFRASQNFIKVLQR